MCQSRLVVCFVACVMVAGIQSDSTSETPRHRRRTRFCGLVQTWCKQILSFWTRRVLTLRDWPKINLNCLVDGQPQSISFFESVETGSTRETAQLAAGRDQGSGPGNTRPTALMAPMAGRSFIFFVDDFHLSPEGVQRTGELLNKFVDQMGEDDRALVMSPSGQIGFLQQLTDHKPALKLAISRIKYQAQSVPASTQRRPMTVYEALAIERNQRNVIEYKTREYMDDMGLSRSSERTAAHFVARQRRRTQDQRYRFDGP